MIVNIVRISKEKRSSLYFALSGFFISLVAFYPGFMSPDSLTQYAMSKSLVFNDWHPPIMSWIWSIFNVFFDGPEGFLFFHLILLWTSLYIWHQLYIEKPYSWMIFCIGFFPWILNFSGVIWKDIGMAVALLLFTSIATRSARPTVTSFVLLFYAINLRHNAIFAAVPILFFVVAKWNSDASKIKIIALTSLILVALIGVGNFFNYEILKTTRSNPSNYMMIDDLSFLSLKVKTSLIPGVLFEDIQDCASQNVGETKLVGRDFCLSKKNSYLEANLYKESLKPIWIEQIAKRPLIYAEFRLAAFAYFLRSPNSSPFYIWHPGINENIFDLKQEKNGLTIIVDWYVHKAADIAPFLFKPYWWLWSSSMLLLLTFYNNENRSVNVMRGLLMSSILYILGYVPVVPMADFRYIYWSVVATSLAGILIIIDIPRFSFQKKLNWNILVIAIALIVTILIFNIHNIFKIDIDQMLIDSGSLHAQN